jgi:hypothetical protein
MIQTFLTNKHVCMYIRCPKIINLDLILRLRNLQLQRQRCSRLERFFKVEKNTFVFKMHSATRGVINLYIAGIVTHDRRIGSRYVSRKTAALRGNIFRVFLIVKDLCF